MKHPDTLFRLCSACAAFAALPLSLSADVLFRQEICDLTRTWSTTCADGTLGASTFPRSASPHDAPPFDLEGSDYFAQSILGDGRLLKSFVLYGTGLNSVPVHYNISVLDYGLVSKPVDTAAEFIPATPAKVLAMSSFTLGATQAGRLVFEFNGEDSVLLRPDHAYIFILAAEGVGKLRLYRMPNGDSYADGACAKGVALSPSVFNPTGAGRDAIFALYTAAP